MRIFNRDRNSDHPLFLYLQKMSKRGKTEYDEIENAKARNYMHDPRVSSRRENELLNFTFNDGNGKDLRLDECTGEQQIRKGLDHYFEDRVHAAANPHFVDCAGDDKDDRLGTNLVTTPLELVNVFLVNGLSRMFMWARGMEAVELATYTPEFQAAVGSFRTLANDADPHAVDSKEFVHLMMKEQPDRDQFISVIFTLYEVYRKQFPYHPIWLTTLSDFEKGCADSTEDEATRWCHLVGKPVAGKDGQWAIVLRFPADQFPKKYRPTVLDTDHAFYFPAPEEAPVAGGLAADVRMKVKVPAGEYIAMFPALRKARVTNCARIKAFTEESITRIREHHIKILREQEFAQMQEVEAWLTRLEEHVP